MKKWKKRETEYKEIEKELKKYINKNGTKRISLNKLKEYLESRPLKRKKVSRSLIRNILINKMSLKYKAFKIENPMYKAQSF